MNFGIIIAMLVIFGTAHLLAAEYIPAQRSKGEVLLFQHGHHEKKPSDAENAEKLPGLSGEVGRRKESKEYNVPFKTTQNLLRQSSVFHWSNLSYHVKTKDGMRTILNSIDGWVKPGEMTALMV
jgi:hypothetical protein